MHFSIDNVYNPILFTETSSSAAAAAAADGAIAVQGALRQGGFPEAPHIDPAGAVDQEPREADDQKPLQQGIAHQTGQRASAPD